jgi:ankyrin repeat protein
LPLLLENNADKTHKDNDGKTAFEHAVFSGNSEIINLLK